MHLLAITPGEGFDEHRWRKVLASGIDSLMIREKQLSPRALLDLARRVQDLAPTLPLWINGRLDVALACGVGFHGPEDAPALPVDLCPVSAPLHTPVQWPTRAHLHQLILSPILEVPGKGAPWGFSSLHAFLEALPPSAPRLLALGGLTPREMSALKHPRLEGVAVIRALWQAEEPARVVDDFRQAWGA